MCWIHFHTQKRLELTFKESTLLLVLGSGRNMLVWLLYVGKRDKTCSMKREYALGD